MHFSKELLQAASELEIRPNRPLSSLLSGGFRSPFRGAGMQFKEFRHYEPGDDVRHISWPVTARTGRATVKVYEEERELNVMLLIDTSGSALLEFAGRSRLAIYQELAALFGLACLGQGHNFGLALFDHQIRYFLPPRKTKHHLFSALGQLEKIPALGRRSDMAAALEQANAQLNQPGLVLILSDFQVGDFRTALKQIRRRHDITLIQSKDSLERGENIRETLELLDPETGEYLLFDGGSVHLRKELFREHRRHREWLQQIANDCEARFIDIDSDKNHEDYLRKMVDFFRSPLRASRTR